MKKFEISLFAGLFIALTLSLLSGSLFRAPDAVRLHVIAPSNSPSDIETKLKVRERVGILRQELIKGADNGDERAGILSENIPLLKSRAESRRDNTCECRVKTFYFPPSAVGDRVLPRGEYRALTVKIGKGEGKNRWRTLYPAFAAGGCANFEEDGEGTLYENERIRIKMKAAEIFAKIEKFFSKPEAEEYDRM